MIPDHQPAPPVAEVERLPTLFGMKCRAEKRPMGTLNIYCEDEAAAKRIILGFWKEYDSRLYQEVLDGKVPFEGLDATSHARTSVIRQPNNSNFKVIVHVTNNGVPIDKKIIDILSRNGLQDFFTNYSA